MYNIRYCVNPVIFLFLFWLYLTRSVLLRFQVGTYRISHLVSFLNSCFNQQAYIIKPENYYRQ